MREPVEGTRYFVHGESVFGTARWRYVITAEGAQGPVVVASGVGTHETQAKAVAAGSAHAHAMVKQLRRDLRRV